MREIDAKLSKSIYMAFLRVDLGCGRKKAGKSREAKKQGKAGKKKTEIKKDKAKRIYDLYNPVFGSEQAAVLAPPRFALAFVLIFNVSIEVVPQTT